MVLFSGGLDSILACKVLQEQGIEVIALKFITPFFSHDLKKKEKRQSYVEGTRERYGINLRVIDISGEYVKMLLDPPHGYGRYLNPCIDCKILMVKKARGLLSDLGASFIATGEVLGQRPMSQRRDTLRIIERDSGTEGILLRPLSAGFLRETEPEIKGMVDRKRLPRITGRSRRIQIELSRRYGIRDYPAPAGGCVLTDPIMSQRFKRLFKEFPHFTTDDCILVQRGRQFILPGKGWLVVGRNKSENLAIQEGVKERDLVLRPLDVPGPYSILRYREKDDDILFSARIVARYVKKGGLPCIVQVSKGNEAVKNIVVKERLSDDCIKMFMF